MDGIYRKHADKTKQKQRGRRQPLPIKQAGWSKSDAGRRASVPRDAGRRRAQRRARGAAATSRPQSAPGSRTLQSSGRPEPAAASEPHPRRRTTGGAASPSRGLTQRTTGLCRRRRRVSRLRGDPVTSAGFVVPLAEIASNVRRDIQSAQVYFQAHSLIG